MTISMGQLQERIAGMFPDAEQVSDLVIRFTKRMEGRPYAVYYFDIAQELPNTHEALTRYQDQVIGSHYFEGKKSLQWSNYLYFITSRERLVSEEVINAKELIERDRNYARKFVIPEEDIERVLTPLSIMAVEGAPQAGILSVWSEILEGANLDRVIFSDDDLPSRLRIIESSSIQAGSRSAMSIPAKEAVSLPFIRSMTLKKYRYFPVQREFNCVDVNLIFGLNGSGKTSLLEAIELFYCGRHKRNPDANPLYTLNFVFSDGSSETVNGSRKPKIFRDRNLAWYGRPEIKTNNLYQGFSQFNFLDTDAAVGLSASTSHIEGDLSKLLVGAEASKTWQSIKRVTEEIAKKLKGMHPLKLQLEGEQAHVGKQITEASSVRQESDSIRDRLNVMLGRAGWIGIQVDNDTFCAMLIEPLAELVSIAYQVTEMEWIASPVSIEGVAAYCRDTQRAIDQAKVDLDRLKSVRKKERDIENKIARDRKAADLASQAGRFLESGLVARAEELSRLQSDVAKLSGWFAGFDKDSLGAVPSINREGSVAYLKESVSKKRSSEEASLADAKKEYREFSELRDQSLNLAQQLREIAVKILQGTSKPDECPLCHTQFGTGELEKHISVGVDEHLEALGRTLLARVREQEEVLRAILTLETVAGFLMKFCERANLADDISVRSVLGEVSNANRMLAASEERLKVLSSEVHSLKSQGISIEQLEQIVDGLKELGYSLNALSGDDLNRLLLTINQSEKELSENLVNYRKELGDLRRAVVVSLGTTDSEDRNLEVIFSELRERLTETEAVQGKLGKFASLFPWPIGKPLGELIVEAGSIRKVAAELQVALSKEAQAKTSYTESIERKEQIGKQLMELLPRIERLQKAHSVLEELQHNHSLNSAMQSALGENRTAIETIFSQIHSPAEFRGLGSTWLTLIRKSGGEAKLTEISSGQRSAFALSVFLAQNAKVKMAPPLILVDDPIAHVDDMNSLSFLDYLREVAINGTRQIFFATANDKLAALFERKFEFLGPERFQKINLTRNV